MSRASVRVRPAEHDDVARLVDLVGSVDAHSGIFGGRGVLDPDISRLQTRLTEILDEGVRKVLVAVDDQSDELVGLLVAKLDEIGTIDLTPALHVTHLLVSPKQRRRGVGRALLAATVQLADGYGVDRILATAASGSREGNRYLSRLGFAPLVVQRVASTTALRRSLGIAEACEQMAVLRRAQLVRAHRNGLTARVIGRGA